MNRLKILRKTKIKGRMAYACLCKCGNNKIVRKNDIERGFVKSCGCLRDEKASIRMKKISYKHGQRYTRFYQIWIDMVRRCNNKNRSEYKNYGGRGIKIYSRWLVFTNFFIDMRYSYDAHKKNFGKKNTTIERINNSGNYCKTNCKWATIKEQANNRRCHGRHKIINK